MAGGGMLAYLVLIPAIHFFGSVAPGILARDRSIAQMGPGESAAPTCSIIGAGAVTAGGLISLIRSLPTIWRGLKAG